MTPQLTAPKLPEVLDVFMPVHRVNQMLIDETREIYNLRGDLTPAVEAHATEDGDIFGFTVRFTARDQLAAQSIRAL